MVEVTSPLQEPTEMRPQARAATPTTSMEDLASANTGSSRLTTSFLSVPA